MSAAQALANLGAYSLQLTLLALAGGLAARAMRLRAPGAMLAYWQGLLAACLLLPALQPWRAVADGGGAVTWETTAGPAAGPGPPLALAPALAIALAAGVLLRVSWLALGWRRLALYRGRARPLDVPPGTMADLLERLGVRARFYVSGEIDAPATFGHRHPAVLVPPAFLKMAPEAQRAVAAHELLHVRRHDWALSVAEETVRAVLWFHPAVHWLVGRIRLCREQVVDLQVAGRLADRRIYLEALLEVARGLVRDRPLPAALMLREGHLKDRSSCCSRRWTCRRRGSGFRWRRAPSRWSQRPPPPPGRSPCMRSMRATRRPPAAPRPASRPAPNPPRSACRSARSFRR